MSPTKFSLRNPLVITAITLALAFFGVYSYLTMGVGIVPNVSFPGVIIITTDAGADPATIETQVTKPLEDAISALPNVDTMTSTSTEGVSNITVQFTTAANSELVPVDVERVVNSARGKLPSTADPPSIQSFDTSAIPVVVVALSGPQPLDQLRQLAQDRVQRQLEGISGVGSVTVSGGQVPEVDVKVDLDKLQAHHLGINSVAQALQSEQLQIPAGSLTQATKDVNVRLNGLVTTPDQLGDIVISQTPQGPVYVKDVATIDNTFAKATAISTVNGKPAVALVVTKLAAANTIAVSGAVHQKLAELQPTLPTGVRVDPVFDLATYTQQSFDAIQQTLIEAVFLTGLVLLVFLHTWRSTLIVLIAIPTSLLTTFGMMNLLGLDLNLFSMLAVTLSVGILVDDSIVVLENIYRHLGLEEPPFVAAINGRSEIGLAAITITMLDVVVYVPIALIPGIAGEFIRPFALVIAAATLTSLAVSFTLTPLLASRFLRTEHALHLGSGPLDAFGRRWEAGFDAVSDAYRRLLHGVLTGRALRF
ncbi:MAG: efflux RND transporter permease subunit, partial [Chloroflexota bacterium]